MAAAKRTPDLVFVVGASRSGTTMFCSSLGLHSEVFGLRETHYFGDLWDPHTADKPLDVRAAIRMAAILIARQDRDVWGAGPQETDYEQAEAMLSGVASIKSSELFGLVALRIAKQHGKRIVVEQTPRNIFYATRLLEIYADSRVVELVRDPRAVLYSQRQKWKMRFLGAKNVPLRESLRVTANYHAITMSRLWVDAVKVGQTLAQHPRAKRVRYEDLVSRPEEILNEVCSFLGIDFQPAMLRIPTISSSTQSNTAEHTGMTRDSLDLWSSKLPAGDRIICEKITQEL
ncbi:MAG: sulfotransferase, partial [Nitrososphaera sp.]|nr:sulfotransferase [Nitrososphaera sp.]